MVTNSLSDEMVKNFVLLSQEEQKSILQMVKTFLRGKEESIAPQTIEDYNNELKVALEAAKKGEVTSFDKLKEEIKLW